MRWTTSPPEPGAEGESSNSPDSLPKSGYPRKDIAVSPEPNPIVVLEGPDFAGKSTAISALVNRFDALVWANGQPDPVVNLNLDYLDQVVRAREAKRMVVFDRLHIGELIYGPLYRQGSTLNPKGLATIEAALLGAGAIKLHVDLDDEELLKRFRGTRGDALVKHEYELLRIAHSYRDLLGDNGTIPGWRSVNSQEVEAVVSEVLA